MTMKNLLIQSLLLFLSPTPVASYTAPKSTGGRAAGAAPSVSGGGGGTRRAFLSNLAGATVFANRALADGGGDAPEDVYFGVGCFWHVQHEFVLAEQTLLGRKEGELTSLTGYAGGSRTDGEGRVCYHNFQSIADYGKLGHGEVVGMTIPRGAIGDFAAEYFKLFGDRGDRVDTMDKGGEYRSLLGLPGGRNHPMFGRVKAAAGERGLTLVDGKGNDPDTLGTRTVYVMDSNKFPFYQAEVYHQYHNDFLSPAYGKKYNDLADAAVDDGRIKTTGCPDRVHRMKKAVQQNEDIILVSIGVATIALILCTIYALWSRPRFLYMPIYNNHNYEKNSDIIADGDDIGTEMAEAQGEERQELL